MRRSGSILVTPLAYAERSEAWTFIGDLDCRATRRLALRREASERAVAIGAGTLPRRTRPSAGFAFLSIGNLPKLPSELKRAKELSPANPTANDLLARAIVLSGANLDEAERQARAGGGTRPSSVTAQGSWPRPFRRGKTG